MAGERADSVLIVGGGIAGIQSALDLAESGIQVYLVEKTPSIGGVLPQLDKQFPTNHCGMCRMLPVFDPHMTSQFCLRRGLRHGNIDLITDAQVESAEGSIGQFVVSIKQNAAWVNPNRCTGCGLCAEVCPVQVADRFQGGLSSRKAIYIKYPQVIPNVYAIDKTNCTNCGQCVMQCPTRAIDLSKEDTRRTVKVGAIILSSGFEEFDATPLKQYGYKKYPNVLSNIELERMLSGIPASQTASGVSLSADLPQNVAFIQCVGSRDSQRGYCSSACCMYAIKEAAMLRELNPRAEISVFFIDLRAYGKTHHRCFEDLKKKGIRFIRCKVPRLEGAPDSEDLLLTYETEEGQLKQEFFGMVVLSVGQTPPSESQALSSVFGIELNKYGFCRTTGVDTSVQGIYACGSFAGPKDIESTIIEASAAAFEAARCLPRKKHSSMTKREKLPALSPGDEDPRIGVFLCSCGGEVGNKVDLMEISAFVRQLPSVLVTEVSEYLCFQDALTLIRDKIDEFHLDRVILGTCEIHSREESYRRIVEDKEFDPSLLDVVDLREHLAWVHEDKALATKKATSLIAMSYNRLRMQRVIPFFEHHVIPRALVIGGGTSGLTAAISIAEGGFEVHVVEKESQLGGNLKDIYYTLEGLDVPKFLKETLDKATKNSLIHIYKQSQVMSIEGSAGDFDVHITSRDGRSSRLQCGAIVVATGAQENESQEYRYGTDPRVVTQRELESMIAQKSPKLNRVNNMVMIQCVGSRDDEHPYCSRVCCSQAIKNGLKIKEGCPATNLYVLYRDMMSYGFKEEFYTAARDKGITFLRYDAAEKPVVRIDKGKLSVHIADAILDANLVIDADLLVLSPGIVPNRNGELAESLGVPLDGDDFFEEADIKFRPLDLTKPGIFCCGLARSPGCLQESLVQARGVASRVMALLSKGEIRARKHIPEVIEEICSGCGVCVRACPYDARKIDAESRIAKVSGLLCQCCGDCAAVCPNGATQQVYLAKSQILAMLDAALDT